MSTTQTTIEERFIERFDPHGPEWFDNHYFEHDTEGILVSDDETISFVPDEHERFGVCVFDQYSDSSYVSWTVGYTEVDDTTTMVYVFNGPESGSGVVIDADKIDVVSQLLSITPAEVADMARTYRYYPILVPCDGGNIVIAPITGVSESEVSESDD